MLSKLKPVPRFLLIAVVVGAAAYGITKLPQGQMKSGGSALPPALSAAINRDDALSVSIVSFHGYAPGLLANGGLKTATGSIYAQHGANINFLVQDNMPALAEVFNGTAQCAWRTSDFWAQEQPNLRNAGFDGRAVMVVDNTRGGDAIISKDPSIRSVEDLVGKTVALLQFTPSHGMVVDAVENSSLSGKKKSTIKYVFINADEGTAGVRAALESGKVDAIALWDPDLSLAVKNTGAHVVYSTASATNLIYDVMVCDSRYLASADGRTNVQKFVAGWMEGVKAARTEPDRAVKVLVDTQEMFKLLAKEQGPDFIKGLFNNVMWTGIEDNVRILGLDGGTNHYERVYRQFDQIYRAAGALANPKSPVINPADSFDYTFIKSLSANVQAAPAPVFTGATAGMKASVTKPIAINFESGSAELTAKSKKTIDTELVPFIENNGDAYIELSGNTDSIGSAGANVVLSGKRAKSVADYLVKQWEVPTARLKVVGNGSSKPICQEPGTADGLSVEECRAANRSTRAAVLVK